MNRYQTLLIAAALLVVPGTPAPAQADGGVFIAFDHSSLSGDIAVEIDGIDMTEFAALTEGGLVVQPDIPLAPGTYDVVVYLWTGEDYRVIATDTVSVEGGAAAGPDIGVAVVNEVEARSLNGDDPDIRAESDGRIEIVGAGGRLKAGAAWLATTETADQLAGRPVDLGEYYLEYSMSGEKLDFVGRLGHQTLSYDRALVSDLNRRGVSAYFTTTDQRLEFGFFGLQSQDAIGVDNGLGLADDDDLMFGGTIAVRPSASTDLQFGITAYSGRGMAEDSLTVGEGDGVAAFFRGATADQRLRYQFDAAFTEFDEDAELLGYSEVNGTAALADLEYDLWQGDTGGVLTLGFAYERVERTFTSLAAPGMAPGREDIRLRFDYYNDQTTLNGLVEHKTTNVGGPDDEPIDRIVTAQLDGTHIPYFNSEAPGWMGSPSLEFGTILTVQDRLETPFLAPPQEDFNDLQVYGGLSVQHDNWSWSATYTFARFDDESAANADETSHQLDATLDWTDSDRWVIGTNTTLTLIDDFTGQFVDTEFGLTASYEFVPGEWNGAFGVNYYDYGAPGSDDGFSVGADVTWNFAPSAELVFSGGVATGGLATESPEDPEWFVGLMLRQTIDTMGGVF